MCIRDRVTNLIAEKNASISAEDRMQFAGEAFAVSSQYDTAIHAYFVKDELNFPNLSTANKTPLRYGENPHQKGYFLGNLSDYFDQLHGKELSYNNLLDVDAAIQLIAEFETTTFAIIKHNNACGLASRDTVLESYKDALAGDPVSDFGGILEVNNTIDLASAELINELFCEVVIAEAFEPAALEILKSKKNRILLQLKQYPKSQYQVRSNLGGFLVQEADNINIIDDQLKQATEKKVTDAEKQDLIFANKLVKHTKSNTIVLAKNQQLLASGTGQTSRVDALNQAIAKAKHFNFDLNGAVMASDAFFPFPDCVEIAHNEGIDAVIQPGGSIKDKDSINYCNNNNMAMLFTGIRHFKH